MALHDRESTVESDGSRLASAATRYDVAEAEALWNTHYGRTATASKIPSEVDAVFRMSEAESRADYLFRIADNQDGIVDLQAAALIHVAETAPELPVSAVLPGRTGDTVIALPSLHGEQHAAFATSFLPGKPLTTFAPPQAIRARIFEKLALLDRALENFCHPSAERSLLWDVSRADQVASLAGSIPDPELRGLAQNTLGDWRSQAAPALPALRRQIIHNDFNPSNILANGNGEITGIIDFGDVIEAPLICDLATAIAYQEPEGGFDALLSAATDTYVQRCPLTDGEVAVLPILVRARAAMVITIAHWRAEQSPHNRAYLLRNVPLASRLLASAAQSL